MSEKHLSSQFDTDLTTISTKVLQMGGLVEAQIARAMRALANFDTALCDQVLAVEQFGKCSGLGHGGVLAAGKAAGPIWERVRCRTVMANSA